jgi:hypothetical protein
LLVEEERTNLFEYSEDLTNPYWSAGNLNGTITANQAAAPDGTITANLYTEDNTTSGRYISRGGNSYTSGTFYTVSVWAKQASGTRYAGLILPAAGFGTACQARFTLSGSGSYYIRTSGTGTTASIQKFSNGWYRCSLTSQATVTTTTGGIQIRLLDDPTDGSLSYTGDGTSGIYLWGAQFEVGSFPTSYIPTEGSTVTRAADVTSITGTNFSSWYEQSEGTVFTELVSSNVTSGRILQIGDGTSNNRQDLLFGSGKPNYFVVAGRGLVQTNIQTSNSVTNGQLAKIAAGYETNNFAVVLNSGSVVTDTSGTLPTSNQLGIGRRLDSPVYLNGTINRLTYWPTRLSNDTLQTITA